MKIRLTLLLIVLPTILLYANSLPNKDLTPGAVDESCTAEKVCVSGYTSTVRNVPNSLKENVLKSYGYDPKNHSKMEIDHLISLELCGSNDQKNLWPEPYEPRPGAHEKDALENYLHKQICKTKTMTVSEAQKIISEDWLTYWRDHLKKFDTLKREAT